MSSKDKILEVALELFYRNGYLGTSVDDIIELAKVSKSNFYYHFKSKEDLGMAVLSQRRNEFQAALERHLRESRLEPRERLLRFVDSLEEGQEARLAKGGCPFGNLVAEMSEHSERFRCHLSELFVGMTVRVADVVAEGQARSTFRPDMDAQDVATLFVQATQGMLLMTKCHKSAVTSGRGVRLLIRLMTL